MKIKCWKCGANNDVMKVSKDAYICDLIAIYTEFGRHSRLVSEYLDCFRTENDVLQIKRHVRLLTELVNVYRHEQFTLSGRNYQISKSGLIAGLTGVVNRINHSMTNHNYLYKILITFSQKEAAVNERAQEKRLLNRAKDPVPENVMESIDEGKKVIRDYLNTIGKGGKGPCLITVEKEKKDHVNKR